MKFNEQSLTDASWYAQRKITLPKFDLPAVRDFSRKNPGWLHFGPGNIFRAFVAALQQKLLDAGKCNYAITVATPNTREMIDKIYRPHDDLTLLVTMNPDQSLTKTVVASIAESLSSNPDDADDWQRLQEIVKNPSLQIISFTITEKGYKVPAENPSGSLMGKIAALLFERYKYGATPVTLLSLDNCSHNGDVLKAGVLTAAKAQ